MDWADDYLLINIIKQPSAPSSTSATSAVSGHFQPRKMTENVIVALLQSNAASFVWVLSHQPTGQTRKNMGKPALNGHRSLNFFILLLLVLHMLHGCHNVDYMYGALLRVFPQTIKCSTLMCCGMHVVNFICVDCQWERRLGNMWLNRVGLNSRIRFPAGKKLRIN